MNVAKNDLPVTVCNFTLYRVHYPCQIDRSPCGSGSTARAALQFFRGHLKIGESTTYKGPAGSTFNAKVVQEVKFGPHDAVVVEVTGKGHYTGSCTFTVEADDTVGKGFLL